MAGWQVAEAHLRLGRLVEQIVSLSEEIGAGVIIVGGRSLGALRRARPRKASPRVLSATPPALSLSCVTNRVHQALEVPALSPGKTDVGASLVDALDVGSFPHRNGKMNSGHRPRRARPS
jgi:hypothetical protein